MPRAFPVADLKYILNDMLTHFDSENPRNGWRVDHSHDAAGRRANNWTGHSSDGCRFHRLGVKIAIARPLRQQPRRSGRRRDRCRGGMTSRAAGIHFRHPPLGCTSRDTVRARHAVIGTWALVHGLAHLIADGQLAEDLATGDYMALSEVS